MGIPKILPYVVTGVFHAPILSFVLGLHAFLFGCPPDASPPDEGNCEPAPVLLDCPPPGAEKVT